jgi:hypothetical protein
MFVLLMHLLIVFFNNKIVNFSGKQQHKSMPRWTEYVEEVNIAAKDAFCLWRKPRNHNCPKFGPVDL